MRACHRAPSTDRTAGVNIALILDVVRHRDHDRALPEQEPALQEQRALVVEQVPPPRGDDELGDDDGDDVVLVAGVELVDEAQDGRESALGTASARSRAGRRGRARPTPSRCAPGPRRRRRSSSRSRWFGASDLAYASASSTPRCTLPTSTTIVWFMRRGLYSALDAEARGHRVVVPLDRLEQHDDRGDDDERDPRAVVNFVAGDDEQHDERRGRADAADDGVHASTPRRARGGGGAPCRIATA